MNSWNRPHQLVKIATIVLSKLAIGLLLSNSVFATTPTLIIQNSATQNPSTQSELAWNYAYQKNYDASLELCDRLIQSNPDNESFQLQRATIFSWANRYRESIQAYQQILAKNPQSIAATIGQAEVLSWDGQYEPARQLYQQVLTTNPNREKALTGMAYISLWQGDFGNAIDRFTTLRQQFPQSTSIQMGLAKTYVARQEIKSAKAVLEPLISAKNADAIALTKEINAIQSNTEFTSRTRSSGQDSLAVNQTVKFRVGDSDTLQSVQVGYGKFNQSGRDVINNMPS